MRRKASINGFVAVLIEPALAEDETFLIEGEGGIFLAVSVVSLVGSHREVSDDVAVTVRRLPASTIPLEMLGHRRHGDLLGQVFSHRIVSAA